jgi:hypothetical protein
MLACLWACYGSYSVPLSLLAAGVDIPDPYGDMRLVFPVVLSWIADHLEMAALLCTYLNFASSWCPCERCLCPRADMGHWLAPNER